MTLTWDSNPHVYGVIHARLPGRVSSVGGISHVGCRVRGNFLGKSVYDGDNELQAMAAVQAASAKLEPHVLHGLLD